MAMRDNHVVLTLSSMEAVYLYTLTKDASNANHALGRIAMEHFGSFGVGRFEEISEKLDVLVNS